MRRPGQHRSRDGRPTGEPMLGPHRGPCSSGKVCYETRASANRGTMAAARAGSPKRLYRCHECRFWHLTSQREIERPPLAIRPVRPGPSVPPA